MNNYKINSELGHGGMATVYLAHDIKFDTHVAVKVLNKEYLYNDNIRKRFLAEARNMFRMSHPNIIKVTDLIDDGDTVAFVMEYIDGETLKDYLDRKGKLGDDEIKSLYTQMLDAIGYVHEQKLVHRDIKPSNFMITPNGKVKLMDFGIAKNTDASTAEYTQTGTGMQMGTPMYMSPEQVKSAKEVLHTSDIYSLGVVLWQMAIGFRYDEKERAERINDKFKGIVGKRKTRNKWEEIEWRESIFPLINNKIFHHDVAKWSENSGIIYPSDSNCVGCFWKQGQQLRKNWDENTNKMQWFANQENKNKRWKKEFTYEQVKKLGLQQDFFFGTGSGCNAGYCTD